MRCFLEQVPSWDISGLNIMEPLLVLMVLLIITSKTSAQFECIGTCYSGRMLPDAKDTFHGKHLKGFSYKNITTDDPRKCYSSCTQDCRCKACQMKDARCELLEEDKNSKADNFTVQAGYVYYDLVQTMYKGKSHMVPPGACLNGCCQSQPCMNGGTCIEHCETPKKKFTCKCKQPFMGRVCKKKVLRSCLDVLSASQPAVIPANGFYTFLREDTGVELKLYCAFTSPSQAWTLLESFSKSVTIFTFVSFGQDYGGYTQDPFNWKVYRLGSSDIRYVKNRATMFMATCNFPQRTTTYFDRDYLFGYLSELDITADITDLQRCIRFAKANLRGHSYINRTLPVFHSHSLHIHIDVMFWPHCEVTTVPNSVPYEDLFGYYLTTNTNFGCTATADNTTQWWVGQELKRHSQTQADRLY